MLGLEPIERDVDRAGADLARRAADDLAMDGGAEGAVAEPQQRQQDQLLELAENRAIRKRLHIDNNVGRNSDTRSQPMNMRPESRFWRRCQTPHLAGVDAEPGIIGAFKAATDRFGLSALSTFIRSTRKDNFLWVLHLQAKQSAASAAGAPRSKVGAGAQGERGFRVADVQRRGPAGAAAEGRLPRAAPRRRPGGADRRRRSPTSSPAPSRTGRSSTARPTTRTGSSRSPASPPRSTTRSCRRPPTAAPSPSSAARN